MLVCIFVQYLISIPAEMCLGTADSLNSATLSPVTLHSNYVDTMVQNI